MSVFVAGRGLVSALGPDLAAAVRALHGPWPAATRRSLGDGIDVPYLGIDDAVPADAPAWWARAERLVRAAVHEAGPGDPAAPLFVASSSVDIGARERGGDLDPGPHHLAEHIARWLGRTGPVLTVSTACTSASNALLSAAAMIRHGAAAEALVLGIELENRFTIAGFGSMQLLSPDAARPLGAHRNGLVLGEAVAALRLTAAPARWCLAGGANITDGSDPAGAARPAVAAMATQALVRADLTPADIDLVKLQAAGSGANDATEVAGLRDVFASMPALVSLKAALGHTLGASGAAEIALLTAALDAGAWPAITDDADPALDAVLTPTAPRARHVLANILGFGGGHAAVVLTRHPGESRDPPPAGASA